MSIESILYSIGIKAYALGVKAAAWRNRKAALLAHGQKDVWRKLEQIGNLRQNEWIWIHAASLGEFEQARPLIAEMRKRWPGHKYLVTFFSPSGYEVRKNWDGADCVCYLPFDTPSNVRRFLDIVKPQMAVFVKYEFWRNYLMELKSRHIPTYLVSAAFRPDQKFFKKSGKRYAFWLKAFTHIFVQDQRSVNLLHKIEIDNVSVAGDTRFDRVTEIQATRRSIPELESFIACARKTGSSGNSLVMMFGSSWPADEAVYGPWLRKNDNVTAIIAPHEFDAKRLQVLKEIVPSKGVLLSELKENPEAAEGKRVLIIDCFGLLSSAYSYADVAYVGGGFGVSIHNINEAAVYGIPVIFGPVNGKFIEAQELKENGGGIEIKDAQSFEEISDKLLSDREELQLRGKAAGDYIASKIGASQRILDEIPKPK